MSKAKGSKANRGVLLAMLTLASCQGRSVALDGDDPMELSAGGADSEGAVVHQLPNVGPIVVDDERLYWVTGSTIHGCLKGSCASSLVDYYTVPPEQELPDLPPSLGVFWYAAQGDDVVFATRTSVMSCPRAGCGAGPRTLGTGYQGSEYAVDENVIVVAAPDGIRSMPRKGGAWTQLVRDDLGVARPIALHAGYIYWVDTYSNGKDDQLRRLRENGAGEVENLTALVSAGPRSLAFDSSFVYITDPRESGGVQRCPLAGCPAGPEDVLRPLRSPQSVAADERGLCVLSEVDTTDMTVSCTTGIEQRLQDNFVHAGPFAMDSAYVYAAHANQVERTPTKIIDISRRAR